jgi:hypothetical protein
MCSLSSFPRARWFTNRRNIASILSLTLYGIALTVLLAVNPDSMLDYAFIGGLIGLLSTVSFIKANQSCRSRDGLFNKFIYIYSSLCVYFKLNLDHRDLRFRPQSRRFVSLPEPTPLPCAQRCWHSRAIHSLSPVQ